jgi:hypothetical protein
MRFFAERQDSHESDQRKQVPQLVVNWRSSQAPTKSSRNEADDLGNLCTTILDLVRFVENNTLPRNLGEDRVAVVDGIEFGSNDAVGRDDDVVAREPERTDLKLYDN